MKRGWTSEEDEYLRLVYSYEDKDIITNKLDKNWATIRARAIKLHLNRSNVWTTEEVELLYKYYPIMKTEKLQREYLTKREVNNIVAKAHNENLKKDDNYLKQIKTETGINNLKTIGDNSGENNWRWKDRIKVKCYSCGKNIEKPEYLIKLRNRFFCCNECLIEWRKHFNKGENNPNFDNGKAWSKEMRLKMAKISTRRIVNKEYSFTETKPQLIINDLLNTLNIKYTNEYDCKYYAIDNHLTDFNLMIEIQGNFFHCNPTMNLKNSREIKIKGKDKSKHTYIKKYHSIEVLYLWEYDIENNFDVCKKLIEEYIQNNGILNNYHSFNYYLEDDKLKELESKYVIGY